MVILADVALLAKALVKAWLCRLLACKVKLAEFSCHHELLLCQRFYWYPCWCSFLGKLLDVTVERRKIWMMPGNPAAVRASKLLWYLQFIKVQGDQKHWITKQRLLCQVSNTKKSNCILFEVHMFVSSFGVCVLRLGIERLIVKIYWIQLSLVGRW